VLTYYCNKITTNIINLFNHHYNYIFFKKKKKKKKNSILTRLLKEEGDSFSLFKIYKTYNKSFLDWDKKSRDALQYAQIITLFFFVYYISMFYSYIIIIL